MVQYKEQEMILKWNLIYDAMNYANVNIKETEEEDYRTRLSFKLMLNKLNVMGSYVYLFPFWNLAQKNLHGGFQCANWPKEVSW
jgi:hypothetical protein